MKNLRTVLVAAGVSIAIAVLPVRATVDQVVNTVAVGGITGLGTGVATALGIAIGSAGGPVTNGGALGTPSSGTATNLSGTAASLTAGTVTTNANLTGDVTSVGNATTLAASARLKSKVITSTRDLTTASGSQALTGVGFQPTACMFWGVLSGSSSVYTSIFGASDSARGGGVTGVSATATFNTLGAGQVMYFADATGGNSQIATISSYDADGLTLSWTKNASPTGTAAFYVICLR
jgi:hypothetical protein